MTEYEAFIAAGCESVADKKRWDAAVAFEREACAVICEQQLGFIAECPEMAHYCADAIRVRK